MQFFLSQEEVRFAAREPPEVTTNQEQSRRPPRGIMQLCPLGALNYVNFVGMSR